MCWKLDADFDLRTKVIIKVLLSGIKTLHQAEMGSNCNFKTALCNNRGQLWKIAKKCSQIPDLKMQRLIYTLLVHKILYIISKNL